MADAVDDFFGGGGGSTTPTATPAPADDVDAFFGVPAPAAQPVDKRKLTLGSANDFVQEGVQQGVDAALGTPGNIVALGNQYLPDWAIAPGLSIRNALLGENNPIGRKSFLPTSGDITANRRQHEEAAFGVKPGEATSSAGRIGQAAISGLVNPTGRVGLAGNVLGASGAEAANEAGVNPLIGGLLGGVAGGALEGGLARAGVKSEAQRLYNEADEVLKTQNNPVVKEEFRFNSQQEKTQALRAVEDSHAAAMAKIENDFATAKTTAQQAQDLAHTEAQQHFDSAARTLGNSTDFQGAGEVAQNAARDWLNNQMPTVISNFYKPLDAVGLPEAIQAPTTALRSVAQRLSQEGGTLRKFANDLGGNLGERWAQRFGELDANNAARAELGVPELAPTTVSDLYALKERLGEAIANPGLVKNVTEGQLRQMYGAVTDDMRSAYREVGGEDAARAFDAANRQAEAVYDFAGKNGPLNKIITIGKEGKETLAPETAAQNIFNLAKKGDTVLSQLRQYFPQAMNEIAAAGIRSDPDSWARLSARGQEALVSDPALRQVLTTAAGARDTASTAFTTATQQAQEARNAATQTQRGTRQATLRQIQDTQAEAQHGQRMTVAQAQAQKEANTALGAPQAPLSERVSKFIRERALPFATGTGGASLLGGLYGAGNGGVFGSQALSHALTGGLAGAALTLAPGPVLGAIGAAARNPGALTRGALQGEARRKKGE